MTPAGAYASVAYYATFWAFFSIVLERRPPVARQPAKGHLPRFRARCYHTAKLLQDRQTVEKQPLLVARVLAKPGLRWASLHLTE